MKGTLAKLTCFFALTGGAISVYHESFINTQHRYKNIALVAVGGIFNGIC